MSSYRSLGLAGGLLTILGLASPLAAGRGVDEASFVQIGGLEQWISVRGEDRRNPVLLVVHGGPGEAQWPMAAKYRPWEKSFTVVQWDQRGAGRTYGRHGAQTPDVSLERITRDGIVRYRPKPVTGQEEDHRSGALWGSIVAIQMVQRRPDLFAAYVGTGQVASWKASVQMQFDRLLAKARADKDLAATKEAEAIGRPDPADAKQYFRFTKGLFAVRRPPIKRG